MTQRSGITAGLSGPAPVHASAGLTGPTLVRVLARLSGAAVPESRQQFADRLGQWLSWSDAISLSTALAAAPLTPRDGVDRDGDPGEACARLKSTLSDAILRDTVYKPSGPDLHAGFLPYRRSCFARQQAMENGIGALRAQLREMLKTRSSALARLAAIDTVMEQTLALRERTLLASVPVLLERHFDRLRRHAEADADTGEAAGDAWRVQFAREMQAVLLAELEHRLQPVEGLLEALRTHLRTERHTAQDSEAS